MPETRRRQSTELAVGVLYRLMRAFLGPTSQPIAVGFTHRPPHHDTIHHRALGPVVRFGEDYDGLRVHVRDLDAPNAMSDPILRGYTRQFLGSIETRQRTTTLDRARELVELLLPTGRCSVEHVARSLGVNRRTVHRRLASEGQTFTALVDATRRDLAARLVRGHNRPLTSVAEMLGFSSHSNFTRWFRSRFGSSPSQWRRTA